MMDLLSQMSSIYAVIDDNCISSYSIHKNMVLPRSILNYWASNMKHKQYRGCVTSMGLFDAKMEECCTRNTEVIFGPGKV